MTRCYIAGPMTGLPEMNFPAFHAAAARLRAQGHDVINPAEINPDKAMSWSDCMRSDIAALVTCNAIFLLYGWEKSKGATLEAHIAERLELEVVSEAGCAAVSEKHSHYKKDVSHLKTLDVYRVLDLFEVTHPALQHALKKVLVAGGRGAKNDEQDVREAIDSLNRWLQMRAEDAK